MALRCKTSKTPSATPTPAPVAAIERWAKASLEYPQRDLPIPELHRSNPETETPWLFEAGGDQLCFHYAHAVEALAHPPPRAIGRGGPAMPP